MTYWISWSFSCLVHLAILLLLALITLANSVSQGRPFLITFANEETVAQNEETLFELTSGSQSSASGVESSELESAMEAESVAPVALASFDSIDVKVEPKLDLDLPARSNDDVQKFLAKIDSTSSAATSAQTANRKGTSASDDTEEVANSDSEEGDGSGLGVGDLEGLGSGSDKSNQHKSGFFGTHVEGKKFVFVVDSSRSMSGARWRVATYELMRTLHNMTSGTEFFIFCFDEVDHQLFGTGKSNPFHVNDPKTLERSQKWIESITLGRGTFPATSLAKAVKMKPDAIYLLSDGVIQDNSVWLLRQINHDKKTGELLVPIHTILLLSPRGQLPLETIATENGGTFKNITLEDILP